MNKKEALEVLEIYLSMNSLAYINRLEVGRGKQRRAPQPSRWAGKSTAGAPA